MQTKLTLKNQLVDMRGVGNDFTKSVLYRAMERPAKRLRDVMRKLAPEETGALRASLDYKITAYPATGVAVAVVGPKKNYRRGGRRPVKYAHLVEFGHTSVAPVKGGTIRVLKGKRARAKHVPARIISFVAAQPFVRPAILGMRTWGSSELASEVEQNLKVTLQTRRNMKTSS